MKKELTPHEMEVQELARKHDAELLQDIQDKFEKQKAEIEGTNSPDKAQFYKDKLLTLEPYFQVNTPMPSEGEASRDTAKRLNKYYREYILQGITPYLPKNQNSIGRSQREREETIKFEATYKLYSWLKDSTSFPLPATKINKDEKIKPFTQEELGVALRRLERKTELTMNDCIPITKAYGWRIGDKPGSSLWGKYRNAEETDKRLKRIQPLIQDPTKVIEAIMRHAPKKE